MNINLIHPTRDLLIEAESPETITRKIIFNDRYRRYVRILDKIISKLRYYRRWCLWISLNKRCTYCGKETTFNETTIDHIIPIKSGGMDRYGNIHPACRPCNNLKGAQSLYIFRKKTIGKRREFYYQTGEEIDVVRARLWMKLYGLLIKSTRIVQESNKLVPIARNTTQKYVSTTRDNLIRVGLIKPN